VAQREAGLVRQLNVEEYHVGVKRPCCGDRRLAVVRLADDLEPVCLQHGPGRTAKARVVVDDEDRPGHAEIVAEAAIRRGTAARTLYAIPFDLPVRTTEDPSVSLTEQSASARVSAERSAYVARGVATPKLVVESASGARVTDVDGRTYLDFAGGIACQNTGHGFAPVVAAVHAQADRYLHQCFMVGTYEPYV